MFTKYISREKKAFTLIELLIVISIIAVLAAILFPVFARARENARRIGCLSNMKQMGLAMVMYAQDYDEYMVPARVSDPGNDTAFTWPSGKEGSYLIWYGILHPYIKNYRIYTCPSTDPELTYSGANTTRISYSYNYLRPAGGPFNSNNEGVNLGPSLSAGQTTANLAAIEVTSETIAVVEGSKGYLRFYPGGIRDVTENTLKETGECAYSSYYQNCLRMRHFDTLNILFVDGHAKAMHWKNVSDVNNPDAMKLWTTAGSM